MEREIRSEWFDSKRKRDMRPTDRETEAEGGYYVNILRFVEI